MKTFIYTIEKSYTNRSMCGHNVTAHVYHVKNNVPNYISVVTWNTASFKGEQSAVMDTLIAFKKVSKKFSGYYRDNKTFR